MKKINLILCAFTLLCLSGCSNNDDNDSPTPVATFPIFGVFYLTEVNTQTNTDFNNDGTANVNQKLESECYDESRMVFNANHTFTYYMNGISVNETSATSSCTMEVYTGTWELYGGSESTGVIHATYTVNGAQTVVQLNKEGNKITNYMPFGVYPDTDANGNPIYTDGELTMIFVKS